MYYYNNFICNFVLIDNVDTAEKVTSGGKDWHRACLKCAKCRKTLSTGQHAVAVRIDLCLCVKLIAARP